MVAHPLRTAADTADANVTEGGITETFLDALLKRMAPTFDTMEALNDFNLDAGSPTLAMIYAATGYVYFYNADDATTPDDGLTCLVTGDGKRYILADSSAIAISSVLGVENDPPASPTDGDAYVVDTAPTGAWVGHAKDIALRTPRGWVFAQPQVGATLLDQQTGLNIQYDETGTWGGLSPTLPVGVVNPESLLLFGGLSVEAQQNAPPVSPAEELYYLVGLSPSGDWVGHENDIAYYTSTSVWAFLAAYDGAMIFNKASDTSLQWFDATGDWRAPWPYQATCQGRLTLETGVAISTTDQTAKATLYFAPFGGDSISLYVNGGWALRSFTEKSLSLAGYTAAKPYDIFGYDDAGVLALESLIWTNATTRATALTTQDGIYVKSGDATRRYLGTIYTSATGQCEDSFAKRFVWNYYNRVSRRMRVFAAATTWTCPVSALRQANGDTTHQIDFVIGVQENVVQADLMVCRGGGTRPIIGFGLDSITALSAFGTTAEQQSTISPMSAGWRGFTGVGRHYLAWLEADTSGGSSTFIGTNLANGSQSGIFGEIWG